MMVVVVFRHSICYLLNFFCIQLARAHRIILLKLMEKICKAHIESVSEDQAAKLITLASAELTMTTEVTPNWQSAASQLLSTLGIRYAHLVMKELLIKFQPGGNPHYFVVYTLGLLATSNGIGLKVFYNDLSLVKICSGRSSSYVGHSPQSNDSNARSLQAREYAVGVFIW